MNTWIFFTITLVSAVIGYVDEYRLVHYSKSKTKLMECLENTNLSKVLNEYDDDLLKMKVLGKLSDLMHEVTVPVRYINEVTSDVVNIVKLRSHLLHMHNVAMSNSKDEFEGDLVDVKKDIDALDVTKLIFDEDEIERVKQAIINALHKCSDPKDPNSEIAPPRFIQEIPELAELLDMILVTRIWEISELSMYSERSLQLIEAALDIMGNAQELFKELTRMWNRRVRLFFDGRKYPEYFLLFYSSNRIVVSNSSVYLIFARPLNYSNRDPPASNNRYVIEMTRYRASSFSNTTSMTKSQYYFKYQVHQFFQMLFTYLETVERGFTENSEINKWEAFKTELPMLHFFFNNAYEAYLEDVQRRELSHEFARNSPIFSSLVRSLEPGDQIDEFDLVMMYWHRLYYVDVVTTTTKNWFNSLKHQLSNVFKAGPSESRTTTMTTESTTSPSFFESSSTSDYDESKNRKGPVLRLYSGKYVPIKKPGSKNNNNINKNPSTSNKGEYSHNSNNMAENYCKLSVDPDDSEESAMLMTTLNGLMHIQGILSCY